MARIKIKIPKSEPLFTTKIPLLINFINYGNHMGNDAILTLCQEVRLRFLKKGGFSELDFYGSSLIQADAAITFKNEGFHGDELEFKLYIDDLTSHGFDFVCLRLHEIFFFSLSISIILTFIVSLIETNFEG